MISIAVVFGSLIAVLVGWYEASPRYTLNEMRKAAAAAGDSGEAFTMPTTERGPDVAPWLGRKGGVGARACQTRFGATKSGEPGPSTSSG